MTPDKYFTPLIGTSPLIPGANPVYKGQCVMGAGLWVLALGKKLPSYPSAYLYWQNGIPGFTKVPKGQPIKQGDIVIWWSNFPPSDGNGHIDVASADGTISDFWAYDSNWVPLKLVKIHHTGADNNYIVGYLRLSSQPNKEVIMPDANDVKAMFLDYNGPSKPPSAHEIQIYTTDPVKGGWYNLRKDLSNGADHKAYLASLSSYPTPIPLNPGIYQVK